MKKSNKIGIISLIMLIWGILIFYNNLSVLAAEPPEDINSLPVKDIPGFHVVDKVYVRNDCEMYAYTIWDGYEYVHVRFGDTIYLGKATEVGGYRYYQSLGYDDQTPQSNINEEPNSKKPFPLPDQIEGIPDPEEYKAYYARYWAFMVLYAPNELEQTYSKVTVKYVDEATNLDIHIPEVYDKVLPGIHSYQARTISNYTHNDDVIKSVSVEVGKEYTVTFRYTKDPTAGGVTINYLDQGTNNMLRSPDILNNESQGAHTYNPITISGYKAPSPQTLNIVAGQSYTINFYYIKTQGPSTTLSAPSVAYVGDDVNLGLNGSSTDKTVTSLQGIIYFDSFTGINGVIPIVGEKEFDAAASSKSLYTSGSVWFSQAGTYVANGQVIDSNGNYADPVPRAIKVTVPLPIVSIDRSGTLKENRKIVVDASASYAGSQRASINWTSAVWQVTAISGGTANDIRIQTHTIGSTNGTILIDKGRGINQPLTGLKYFDILFKKAGQYMIKCTLTNNYGGSSSEQIILNVIEDQAPVANYSIPSKIYRDPYDLTSNGYAQATFNIEDSSYSPDGDIIAKRAYIICIDTDNNYDGVKSDDIVFGNETYYIYDLDYDVSNQIISTLNPSYNEYSSNPHLRPMGLFKDIKKINIDNINIDNINTGNLTQITYKTMNVGHRITALIVQEEFGQETIPQFVTTTDRRINNFD